MNANNNNAVSALRTATTTERVGVVPTYPPASGSSVGYRTDIRFQRAYRVLRWTVTLVLGRMYPDFRRDTCAGEPINARSI